MSLDQKVKVQVGIRSSVFKSLRQTTDPESQKIELKSSNQIKIVSIRKAIELIEKERKEWNSIGTPPRKSPKREIFVRLSRNLPPVSFALYRDLYFYEDEIVPINWREKDKKYNWAPRCKQDKALLAAGIGHGTRQQMVCLSLATSALIDGAKAYGFSISAREAARRMKLIWQFKKRKSSILKGKEVTYVKN